MKRKLQERGRAEAAGGRLGAAIAIKARMRQFTGTERRLADYLLEHLATAPFLSVGELAKAVGVSAAAVSRFARRLGYPSLRAFKARLGHDALASSESLFEAIGPRDGDADIVGKVFQGNVRSLQDTLSILDRAALVRAGRTLAKARRIVFFGVGGSGHVAGDAALRFAQLDMEAEAGTDAYRMIERAARLGAGDVAVGISHSGRSALVVRALRLAREGGALTLGIANYLQSPLQAASDLFFLTSFPESRVRVAALSSCLAQMCLLDALYLVAARHRRVSPDRIKRLNAIVDRYLRGDDA